MIAEQIACRRAIEAIRTGVPNRDAVRALGCSQPHIEEKFAERLRECLGASEHGRQPQGLLITGDFGTGKSHLLEHLHHLALEQNFVSSKIVISKETPLFDPVKFYRAAIDCAVVPGKQGSALREIAQTLDDAKGYAPFYQRVTAEKTHLDPRFGATLFIYDNVKMRDLDLRDRVILFWSGRKLNVSEIKRALHQLGEGATYRIGKMPDRELALQRFRFASEMIVAAGYSGWVLLVDEVELISRYSLLQRARSYAELARWMGVLGEQEGCPSILTVLTLTPDFSTEVIDRRNDREHVSARLTARGTPEDLLLASQAERGIREIERPMTLRRPDFDRIQAVHDKLRELHSIGYGWDAPAAAVDGGAHLTTTPLRQYVRKWVNQWDLLRLYPAYQPDLVTKIIKPSYGEDKDLETSSEANAEDDAPV